MGVRRVSLDGLQTDLLFQIYNHRRHEIDGWLLARGYDGGAEDLFSDAGLAAGRKVQRRQIFGIQIDLIVLLNHQNGQEDETQLRIAETLQEEQRFGVRLLQKQEGMLVLESRQTVRKMKDSPVGVVEFTEVSSVDLGHKLSDLELMQSRGRNRMNGGGYFFFAGAGGVGALTV